MSQFAFKRTGDSDYPRYLKVLLQGPPKSGKTTFLTTAPNVVVASCEAGLMSIAHLDVPYVNIDGTDKLQQLELILRDDGLRASAAKQLGLPEIETVAIDTLDAWQEMLKREILAENRRTAMQQADWGTLKERMATIMKRFVTLPMNVIFTVHTGTTQDDEQRLVYAPALQGSIKDEIAGYVDFSLLAFRQRETSAKGVARIAYYLKNEGDQKNPHLGNRAAGRVPEVCAPNFVTLRDAVFSAVKPLDNRVIKEEPDVAQTAINLVNPAKNKPVKAARTVRVTPEVVEPVAQSPSQPEPQLVVPPAPSTPTGIPEDNPEGPINASGMSMLSKAYIEHGFAIPLNLNEWTLKKAWAVAKYFMAWKTDKAAGRNANRDDLIEYLNAVDAFNGEVEGIALGVKQVKAVSENKKKTPQPESNDPAQEAEEAALALVENQLGGVVIGHDVAKDAKCEECGDTIDDVDIAILGVTRYRRVLCTKDYHNVVKVLTQ